MAPADLLLAVSKTHARGAFQPPVAAPKTSANHYAAAFGGGVVGASHVMSFRPVETEARTIR